MLRDNGNGLLSKAEAAFRQAALKVIQRAKASGTPVVIWKDGRILEIPAEKVKLPDVQGQKDLPKKR